MALLLFVAGAFTWLVAGHRLGGHSLLAVAARSSVRGVAVNSPGFAVVELFTSEGCSSCPPADELVASVAKEDSAEPVYILSFHVDYWNRLGWTDAFSNAAYTKRQGQYADWLQLPSVYTPQIVVNGSREFIGSQSDSLHNAIQESLLKPSGTRLTLQNIQVDKGQVSVQYHAEGIDRHTLLVLALVQKSATSRVERGENGGRTLSHVQIVRSLASIGLKGQGDGTAHLTLPADIGRQPWELIAFAQNNTTGVIIAAAKLHT